VASELYRWLEKFKLENVTDALMTAGYDDVESMLD
jgi:hypothetical protein